eukprot:5062433-Prymnesium_polylepis.4
MPEGFVGQDEIVLIACKAGFAQNALCICAAQIHTIRSLPVCPGTNADGPACDAARPSGRRPLPHRRQALVAAGQFAHGLTCTP